ncbi:fimbrial protein [Pseudomonas sp. MDT1-17]
MKRAALIVAMTAFPLVAVAASSNTLTFKGEVASQTCEVSINGSSATVVLLPTVSEKSLNSSGATAGDTSFSLMLSGCSAPSSDLSITTNFQGSNVTSGGNLRNSGTAAGIALQLLAPDGKAVKLSGLTRVSGLTLRKGETSTSSDFTVRYINEDGKSGAGTVTSTMQYSISYL